MENLYIWIIATLAGYYIKGLCGFANTLVFTSILGFARNNIDITPVDMLLGFPANIIVSFKNRRFIKVYKCLPLIIMILLGSIPGAFLLKNVDGTYIKIFFGIVLCVVGMDMLLREYRGVSYRDSKILMTIVGIISGILMGMFGVGALIAAFISRSSDSIEEFKGTISTVFLVENIFRIFTYLYLGVFTIESLRYVLILIPFVFVGIAAGMYSSRFLSEKKAKLVVMIMLILSGASLAIKSTLSIITI